MAFCMDFSLFDNINLFNDQIIEDKELMYKK